MITKVRGPTAIDTIHACTDNETTAVTDFDAPVNLKQRVFRLMIAEWSF